MWKLNKGYCMGNVYRRMCENVYRTNAGGEKLERGSLKKLCRLVGQKISDEAKHVDFLVL